MNPDSFKGKMYLSFIDKIIFALIAGVILLLFQNSAHRKQQILDARISVAKIYTDIIVKQREDLTKAVGEYLFLIEKVVFTRKIETSQKQALSDLYIRIIYITDILCSIKPSSDFNDANATSTNLSVRISLVEKSIETFLDGLDGMNLSFSEAHPNFKIIKETTKRIRNNYMDLVGKLKDLTVEIVKTEAKAASLPRSAELCLPMS